MTKFDDLLNSAQAEKFLGKLVSVADHFDGADTKVFSQGIEFGVQHWLARRAFRKGVTALYRWHQGEPLSSKDIRNLVDGFSQAVYFAKLSWIIGASRGQKLLDLLDTVNRPSATETPSETQKRAEEALTAWLEKQRGS